MCGTSFTMGSTARATAADLGMDVGEGDLGAPIKKLVS